MRYDITITALLLVVASFFIGAITRELYYTDISCSNTFDENVTMWTMYKDSLDNYFISLHNEDAALIGEIKITQEVAEQICEKGIVPNY